MSIQVKISQSFLTQEQFVEVSNNQLGGLILKICEIDEQKEAYNPRLYLEKDEALALAKMLIEIANN